MRPPTGTEAAPRLRSATGLRGWPAIPDRLIRACRILLWIFVCGLFAGPLAAQPLDTAPQAARKNILLLYSYGRGGKGVGIFDEGFLSVTEAAGIKVNNLFFEYLDLERNKDDKEYRPRLHQLLLAKYATRKIDLILTIQQPALQFLLHEGRDIATAAPAITLQAPMPGVQEAQGRRIISQLARFDIKGTLERALDLFPQTRQVMFVSGSSEADRKIAAEAASVAASWQDKLRFDYTSDIPLHELLQRVSKLPPHSIIIFTQYNRDVTGQVTIAYEVEGMVVKAANAPVFGLYDFNLRNGGIGGSVVSVNALGQATGNMALDILDGKYQPIRPVTAVDNPVIPMFNWSQIERWNANPNRLPQTTIFVNRTPTFWEQYKHYVIAIGLFCIAQSLLIAGLMINKRRRTSAEALLRESEQRLALATRSGGVGIWDWNLQNNALVWNDLMYALHRARREDFASAYGAGRLHVHPQDLERTLEELKAAIAGTKPFNTEYRLLFRNGDIRHLKSVAQVFHDDHGTPLRMVGTTWDITERKKADEELQLAASIFHASSEAMLVTDAENIIVAVNPAFTQITGYTLGDLIGKTPRVLKSGRHDQAFYLAMWQELKSTGQWRGEIWDRNKNGDVVAKRLSINTIHNADGSVHRRIALSSDITEKKQAEEMIWRQANFDALTSLPNRSLFLDRLAQEIKKTQRENLSLALLFIDLDHFKEVNDTLGHDVGDLLLSEAALRINACVRQSDTVARMGGDEFTVVLPSLTDTSRADEVAQAILQALAQPFKLRGEELHVSASIGITLYPHDAADIETLLKNADQAMYVAKSQGRNGFSYFIASMQEAARARQGLIRDLRGALAGGQLALHFQPIIELSSGRIRKAEALLRWHHPEHGMISPARFIPLAEETGLIHEIGDWVFRETARVGKRWLEAHGDMAPMQISVNKSPRQFISGNTDRTWLAYLNEIGLPAEHIVIEITEGLLLEGRTDVREKLSRFRNGGIRIALDDFGTGYSSMAYLKKFPIDFLKIDQSFVRDMSTDASDQAIVEAIIVMARKLGLKVIAEGVETMEQCDLLTAAGCDYVQGYLFARPLPAEDFEALLHQAAAGERLAQLARLHTDRSAQSVPIGA
jgi:diguanylate cyclase (GGDEF)-like protein/PAS domain S-box-containing protein